MSSPTSDERIFYTKQISKALQNILKTKSSRTQNWLAGELGISSATLTNVFKKGSILTAENIEKAARYLLKDTNRSVLDSSMLEDMKNYLSRFETNPIFGADDKINDKIERWLLANSDESLLTFFLSCNSSGVSLKHLQMLGRRYVDALDELIAKKWVYQDVSGKYIYFSILENFNYKSNHLLKRFILLASSFVQPESYNNKSNLGMIFTESLSEEAMKSVSRELVKTSNKIESIINDPKNKGDQPCFISLLFDTLA